MNTTETELTFSELARGDFFTISDPSYIEKNPQAQGLKMMKITDFRGDYFLVYPMGPYMGSRVKCPAEVKVTKIQQELREFRTLRHGDFFYFYQGDGRKKMKTRSVSGDTFVDYWEDDTGRCSPDTLTVWVGEV